MSVYLEARFLPVPDAITVELLTLELAEIGFESFTEGEEGFSAFIQDDTFSEEHWRQALAKFPLIASPELIKHLPQNWNAVWESQFEPICIDDNCWIRAPFHEVMQDVPLQLIIEPKMSFGTGHHETTRLMCRQMLKLDFAGKMVWDYGCGTGVLGILAARLEAQYVAGNDIESWAVENSRENAQRNHVDFTVYEGGVEAMPDTGGYDIILANINRNVLIQTADAYLHHLKPGGWLLISGFLAQDEASLISFFVDKNLQLLNATNENGWSCLLFAKE